MKTLLLISTWIAISIQANASELANTTNKYDLDCKEIYTDIHGLFINSQADIQRLSPTHYPKSLTNFANQLYKLDGNTTFCQPKNVSIDRNYFISISSDTSLLVVLLRKFNENNNNDEFLINRAKNNFNKLIDDYEYLSKNYSVDNPLHLKRMPNNTFKRDAKQHAPLN